jgi:hypothetical protein
MIFIQTIFSIYAIFIYFSFGFSWDSAFIAVGKSHYDQEQAQEELRTLFKAQWKNGLLPHIVFNPNASK